MLVTVLMSVYNGEKYLADAINSILNQTYKEFEFIIIDDGSTDNSKAIIESYASRDQRIVFINNKTNIGLACSLNRGIGLATGKYIARQDADDLSSPERLEVQLQFANENEQIGLIGSDCYVIDLAGNVVYEDTSYSKINNYYDRLLNCRAIFPHGSALVKKSVFTEIGFYDSRFYYSQDGEFWLRVISNGTQVHTINKPLYYYRTLPRADNKKHHVQLQYNNVKRMIYRENRDTGLVKQELEKIKDHLTNANLQPRSNYMADYWKSLANAAYLNNSSNGVVYKYLYKAVQEKNAFVNYPRYIILSLLYILPPSFIKRIFKFN